MKTGENLNAKSCGGKGGGLGLSRGRRGLTRLRAELCWVRRATGTGVQRGRRFHDGPRARLSEREVNREGAHKMTGCREVKEKTAEVRRWSAVPCGGEVG